MFRRLLVVTAAIAAITGYALPARGCDGALPDSLRILDCRLAAAAADALRLSPTLRAQLVDIESRHAVVYVTTRVVLRPGTPHQLAGLTANDVDRSGDRPIARVELVPGYDDRAIATLGHELHHVVEILSQADAHAHYAISSTTVETDGAQDVERLILRELHAAHHR